MAGKRKSDTVTTIANAKKAKTVASDYASAKAILAGSKKSDFDFDFTDETAVRKAFSDISNYVGSLENEVEELKEAQSANDATKPAKAREQIEKEADRIAENVVRGIKRQLTWKPSCKTNSAKFVFDGLCPDPLVFGAMLHLDGPPKFKLKKMPGSEFEELVGQIIGSARYNDLFISKSDVNIRYNAESGEFKISGTYGIASY